MIGLNICLLISGVRDAGQPWRQCSAGCTHVFWHAGSGESAVLRTCSLTPSSLWILVTASCPLQLNPLGCNLINVPSDQHGMIPAALREILSRWDLAEVHKPGSTAPKVLYTIPNGGNPTGASMTTQRKQEVYEVCEAAPCGWRCRRSSDAVY